MNQMMLQHNWLGSLRCLRWSLWIAGRVWLSNVLGAMAPAIFLKHRPFSCCCCWWSACQSRGEGVLPCWVLPVPAPGRIDHRRGGGGGMMYMI